MNINNITLAGRLTRDPELRNSQDGKAIAQLSIAWNDYKKNGHFFDATFFGRKAEVIGEYFKKGDCIGITGELNQDQWEDKETGQKRSKVKIMGRDFSFGQKGEDKPAAAESRDNAPF